MGKASSFQPIAGSEKPVSYYRKPHTSGQSAVETDSQVLADEKLCETTWQALALEAAFLIPVARTAGESGDATDLRCAPHTFTENAPQTRRFKMTK